MGFVIAKHYQLNKFIGYEMVHDRVTAGARALQRFASELEQGNSRKDLKRGLAGLSTQDRVQMIEANLNSDDFTPAPARYYFLYDFGSRRAIEKVLLDLREVAKSRKIVVIARGRSSRDAIERDHPWLSEVVPPEHFAHSSFYRSAP